MRRLEDSETGRLVISAFVLVVVVCLVANAIPDTVATRPLGRPVASLFGVTGLDQGWGLFAPNPRRQQIDVSARVEFADGSAAVWRIPRGGPVIAASRDYRWRKWMEHVVFARSPEVARRGGRYAARAVADGRRPVRVVVTRRSRLLPKFGKTTGGPWVVKRTVVGL
jgi:hypothetical protein